MKKKPKLTTIIPGLLSSFSLLTIVVTFLVSISSFTFPVKAVAFLIIVFLYSVASIGFYVWQKRQNNRAEGERKADTPFNSETESQLFALEEANEFFGTSLKSADMFRLVASRINELVPFVVCLLFLAEGDKEKLKIKFAVGEHAGDFMNLRLDFQKGLAGKTYFSRKAQIDDRLLFDKDLYSKTLLTDINSAVAVPLFNRGQIFGVLQVFGESKYSFDENSLMLLEAVGERVSKLFLSSLAFEKSLENALTDKLTNLPNERAFYLVLENQIAEAERYREQRPLSVLTIDIKNFNEINQKYGHVFGDRILFFAAEIIKTQLRQMDFLARSMNDEFLAVLPTASEQVSQEIIGRIEKAFVTRPFEISVQKKIYIQLNFGAATFWKDGETAPKLLQTAMLKKQQSKSIHQPQVLFFPKEYVN